MSNDKSSSGQSFAEMFETQPTYFKRSQFDKAMKDGKNFMFGSATSAFQIEGGRSKGKDDSIWDIFAEKKGFFKKYGEDAVNHHEHFMEDVGIMKEIGFNAYRFSISWSRIIRADGDKNQEGIKFYRGLLEELKKKGISPFVTLYHWDTPAVFQTKDFPGFLDRRIAKEFGKYAQICFEEFGDLVENWITLNEPYTLAIMAYLANVHAPGFGTVNMGDLYNTGTNRENKGSRLAGHRLPPEKTEEEKKKEQIFELPSDENLKDTNAYPYIATHNMLLAHGEAVKKFREYQKIGKPKNRENQKIGITLVSKWFEPYNRYDSLDEKAAKIALDFILGWYLGPLVHGKYPECMRSQVENAEKHLKMTDEDRELIQGSYDFIGVNYYTARYVRYKVSKPKHLKNGRNYVSDQHLKYYETCKLKCTGRMQSIGKAKGASAWLISYPPGMQKLLKHIKDNYEDPIMYVTENGIDDHDDDSKKDWGSIFDHKRLTYIRDHLYYLRKALIKDKVKVKGYFVWSLLDNFEWNNNFDVRFGITYVNFNDGSRKRHLKLSAAWLQYFLAGREKQEVTTQKLDDDNPSESDDSSDDERN